MNIINIHDKNYPPLLREIYSPPERLYAEGEFIDSDFSRSVAIVGTRNPSSYGKEAAYYFSFNLAKAGLTIISGLARGIDTVAHQAALEAGGRTIAVLGTGVDNIYPSQNKGLAQKIIKSGVLVSQFEPGTTAFPANFPVRNQVIAGLSKVVLVIEAPEKSGALITARIALKENREVFCVPGSIFSKNSAGTNAFIKEGACLANDYKEILAEFGIMEEKAKNNLQFEDNNLKLIYQIILDNDGAIHVDEIIKRSKLTSQVVNTTLALMELNGDIKNFGKGKYSSV